MPIQFRCTGCNQKLAITRRKAGKKVKCPACAAEISVPTLDEAAATGDLVESPQPSTRPSAKPSKPAPPPEPPPPPPPPVEPATQQSLSPEEKLLDGISESVFDQLTQDDFVEDEFTEDELTEDDFTEDHFTEDDVAEGGFTEDEYTEEYKDTFAPAEADDVQTEQALPTEHEPVSRQAFAETSPATYQPPLLRDADEEDDEEEGFHLHRRGMDESGLDMTPMVDVTFLLLIFFMITATFSLQKSMETEAPEPEDEGAAQLPTMDDFADNSVIVEIDENDVIFVDEVQIAGIGELVDVLELKFASEDKTEMIIDPHPQAKHGTVVQATDAGIEVGMQRIRRVSRQGADE